MKRNQSQEQLTQERRGSVQISVRIKPTQDGDQSIFGGDDETGRSVIASKQPQKSRQVQTNYKNDKDLDKVNRMFPGGADVFFFDNTFNQKSSQSQEIFYRKTAKEAVATVISGQNTSILIHGPSREKQVEEQKERIIKYYQCNREGVLMMIFNIQNIKRCGKTFAFTGAEKHQKGLMFRCVDDLLSKIDVANHDQGASFHLQLSIFSVYNNEIFDLLSNDNQDYYEIIEYSPTDVRIAGLSKHEIKYKSEYKNKYVSALRKIQSLSQLLNEKKLYEKSHIVVQFNIQEGESINFKLNLVRLADSDLVDKQINGDDFDVIEQYINQINQNTNFLTRVYKKSKLTACIKDTLNEHTQSYFICCVSSSSNQYAQSLLALDYTQRLCSQGQNHNDGHDVRGSISSINPTINASNSQKRLIPSRPPVSPNSIRSSHVEGSLRPSLSQSNIRPLSAISQSNIASKQNQGANNQNNSHTEFIMNEAESIFDDIRKQSRMFGRLPERERNEWVAQKEHILNDLQRQLEAQPYTRDIPYCETLLTKCQRQLRLINPNLSDQRQISGSPPRSSNNQYISNMKGSSVSQQNFHQGNMNNSFSRVNHNRRGSQVSQGPSAYAEQFGRLSPSQENRHNDYEFLRDKEEKLDKDFMRLLDRYNHSKELIDSLSNPMPQQPQQDQINYHQQRVQTQPSLGSRSPVQNFKKNYQTLLSPQQQRTIDISSGPQQFNQDLHRSQDSSGFLDQPTNHVGRSRVSVQNAGELSPTIDLVDEKEKNVGKSLKRLKETIEMKENIEKSKIQKLRQQNKELRQSLRDYVEKCEEVAEVLRNKDSEIDRFEYELRQAQEDILLNVDTVKEFKIKEQGWLQMEEELREVNMQLKSKLLKKKKKVNQIKEEYKKKEEEINNQQKQYEHDIQRYQRTVSEQEEIKAVDQNKSSALSEIVNQLRNDMEQREQEQKQAFQNLQEMRNLNQELTQKISNEVLEKNETINQNHALTRKKEELEEQVHILEQKIQKHKQKFEDEKNKFIEEKNKENAKKKDKIKYLKAQLADSDDKQQELEGKYQHLIKQADNLEAQLRETSKYLNELKEIKDEQTYKIAKLTEEKNNSYLECERLQNLVTSLEGRVEKFEASQLVDARTINELKEECSQVQDQLSKREDEVQKANELIHDMQEQQNIELSTFEIRLDQVVQEFTACKDENSEYKRKETENKKHLASMDEQVEKYKEKYLKAKHSNKNLQQHLKELENRVKEYMSERSVEVQNQARERERQSKVEQTQKNKLRILDEIQQMIKSHKQTSTNQKYEH